MKVTYDQYGERVQPGAPDVFVISDSLGDSALNVVLAAAAQFSEGAVRIVRLSQIVAVDCVRHYFDEHDGEFASTAIFHSIVDPQLRNAVKAELNSRGIVSIDILGPVVQLLASLTGERPKNLATAHHAVDSHYLRRVSAMEFFVAHDDGKNPQDLDRADVVLIGLTGSAKTPLAMHLSFLGYNVASVSLDPGCDIPEQLFSVPPERVFGLETTPDVLAESRKRRLAEGSATQSVPVGLAEIERDQKRADEVMDRIGCARLSSGDTTVEELTADILSRIEEKR